MDKGKLAVGLILLAIATTSFISSYYVMVATTTDPIIESLLDGIFVFLIVMGIASLGIGIYEILKGL